jgi:hypothetical protein
MKTEDNKQKQAGEPFKGRVLIATHYLPYECILANSPELASLRAQMLAKDRLLYRSDSSFANLLHRNSNFSVYSDWGSPPHIVIESSSATSTNAVEGGLNVNNHNNNGVAGSADNGNSAPVWKFRRRRDHSAMYSGILSLSRGGSQAYNCVYFGSIDRIYDEHDNSYDIAQISDQVKNSLARNSNASQSLLTRQQVTVTTKDSARLVFPPFPKCC